MAVRIEAGAEPIPGYKLLERLGGGGFGEVWKAEAPGGLFKAIKFVYGDLHAADDDDGARAEQELKAMSRVKSVHHPYILSLERYDIIDGQLIIVMELADRTLWDRYKESRAQGNPGIPRDELLGYIQESAEALDLMNIEFQLQHLDIKPQNLFLVFKHIKVADFGLVKDLGNMGAATMTGGVTPVYAAPETFDGWLSRFSDQYSLAIVYQELLTGQRPFAGNTMRQLVLQHLQGTPDVSALPAAERPVILRALSKNPDDRFPTCLEMVQALRNAKGMPVAATPVPTSTPAPQGTPSQRSQTLSCPDSDFFKGAPSEPGSDVDKTWGMRKGGAAPSMPSLMPGGEPKTAPHSVASYVGPISSLPPRPGKKTMEMPPPSSHLNDAACRGIVQPSLVIGLGDLGVKAIQQLRLVLGQEFGQIDAVPHIRLLGINTDGDTVRDSTMGDVRSALRPHEFVLARLHRANHYVHKARGDGKLPTDTWLSQKVLYRISKENARAPLRPLGRFAFITNMSLISKRLQCELQACCSQDTLHEMSQSTDLGIRSSVPRVYIVANLAGATGSGMFIDMAYLVRSHLRAMGHADAEVVGLFFLPAVKKEGIRSGPLANVFAALSELNYFTQVEGMQARYDSFEAREPIHFREGGAPFQRCLFLTLAEPKPGGDISITPEAVIESGHFLYRDLATPIGKSLDKLRKQRRDMIRLPGATGGTLLETFGLHRVGWPRRDVQTRLAQRFCTKLVDRWRTKKADHLVEEIVEWVGQQWDALEMRPENLIARHLELSQHLLETPPEKILQEAIAPAVQAMSAKVPNPSIGPVLAAMDKLEKLIGIPEQCRDVSHRNLEPGTLERTLMEVSAGIADSRDQKLAEIVVGLIEAPRYRLAGAEEALRRLGDVAEAALKVQEGLAKELYDRAGALYTRIKVFTDRFAEANGQASTTTQWFGRSKGMNPSDLVDLLRAYPKAQFQSLLLQCLNRLYISIRGHLSDQLREVGFCRTRLDELAGYVQEKKTSSIAANVEFEKHLLPQGCKRLDDVIDQLDAQLVEDDFMVLDDKVQAFIKKQYKALLNVCLGASGMVRALAPVMIGEAEAYLDTRFPPPSVVDLMRADEMTDLGEVVRDMYEEAAPDAKTIVLEREFSVAGLPDDEQGQGLAAVMASVLPDVKVVPTDRCEEILFVREQILTSLNELEQMGPIAQEAYRQRLAQDPISLHSREDIPDWNPQGAPV